MSTMMRAVVFAAIALAPAAVPARTLYVANDGFDESGCGARSAPCRSISEAVAHASPRDRIEVGPGAYGELDGDGVIEPGDEDAELGFGCNCAIKVDKALTIISTLGAGSTVIKAGANFFNNTTLVRIQSDDVVFGRQNQGFHITVTTTPGAGAPTFSQGIKIDPNTQTIKVEGNLVTNLHVGIGVEGDGHSILSNTLTNNIFGIDLMNATTVLVKNNTAISNRRFGIQSSCSDGVIENKQMSQNDECGISAEVIAECKNPEINQNNIYSNGMPTIHFPPIIPIINCGVRVATSSFDEENLPDLTRNYWGAAEGPGPDPADEAFGVTVSGDEFVISDVFPVAKRAIRMQGIK